jgi:hypothetical protein
MTSPNSNPCLCQVRASLVLVEHAGRIGVQRFLTVVSTTVAA